MTLAPAVALEGISCRFGRVEALRNVSLTIQPGTVFGIVGPNGAGKSTLIEVVTGVVKPDQGQVQVMGFDVRRQGRQVRALIGVLPQETALYGELSAVENLRFAADLYSVADAGKRIAEVLALVGLTARAGDTVRSLSGGMQRRLAIARAMVHSPELLILDEPTLGVDIEARHEIWVEIRAMRAQGRTVILTTNYLDEAEALCDDLAILRDGRLLARDSPAALLEGLGRCVDFDCEPDAAGILRDRFQEWPGMARSELTASGITLYLAGRDHIDGLVQAAMAAAPVAGFRDRAPDLAELIRMLPAPADAG